MTKYRTTLSSKEAFDFWSDDPFENFIHVRDVLIPQLRRELLEIKMQRYCLDVQCRFFPCGRFPYNYPMVTPVLVSIIRVPALLKKSVLQMDFIDR